MLQPNSPQLRIKQLRHPHRRHHNTTINTTFQQQSHSLIKIQRRTHTNQQRLILRYHPLLRQLRKYPTFNLRTIRPTRQPTNLLQQLRRHQHNSSRKHQIQTHQPSQQNRRTSQRTHLSQYQMQQIRQSQHRHHEPTRTSRHARITIIISPHPRLNHLQQQPQKSRRQHLPKHSIPSRQPLRQRPPKQLRTIRHKPNLTNQQRSISLHITKLRPQQRNLPSSQLRRPNTQRPSQLLQPTTTMPTSHHLQVIDTANNTHHHQ